MHSPSASAAISPSLLLMATHALKTAKIYSLNLLQRFPIYIYDYITKSQI